jgi:hypothetical protein
LPLLLLVIIGWLVIVRTVAESNGQGQMQCNALGAFGQWMRTAKC